MFVDASAIAAILIGEPEANELADLLYVGIKSIDLVTKLTQPH